jgi:hypothetical protein
VELWTDKRAAQHWGVTPSRARAILSTRRIRRVTGYPADQVRAVTRRQGARTDLAHVCEPVNALTVGAIADAITRTSDEAKRLRYFFEFMRGADQAGVDALKLIAHEPAFTSSERFDALLAAAAEHLAARFGQPGPLWTLAVDRFLVANWWTSDLPSARAFALVWTPASFRRRGIYLDRHDLTTDETRHMPEPDFDRSELHRAFTLLATKLERKRVVGHVHVVGGAAMLLAYNSRITTRDIDALFSPDGPMLEAIDEVASEMSWPATWLNNQASGYVSRHPGEGSLVFDHPHLQVTATPPEHLLAMKVLASRSVRDRDDIQLLLNQLRITAPAGVWALVDRYFPDTVIPDRARLLIEDLLPL